MEVVKNNETVRRVLLWHISKVDDLVEKVACDPEGSRW